MFIFSNLSSYTLQLYFLEIRIWLLNFYKTLLPGMYEIYNKAVNSHKKEYTNWTVFDSYLMT